MSSTAPISSGRKRVFNSVFSPASLGDRSSTATLSLGLTPSDQSFGSVFSSATGQARNRSQTRPSAIPSQSDIRAEDPDQSTSDRAWQAATSFLALPDKEFEALGAFENLAEHEFLERWNRRDAPSKETVSALAHLITLLQQEDVRANTGQGNVIEWYENQIRGHFLRNFRDGLQQVLSHPENEELLQKIVHCLQLVRRIYFAPLVEHILPLLDPVAQEQTFLKLQRTFHMMVAYVLPWARISALLTREVAKDAFIVLGIDTLSEDRDGDDASVDEMEVDREYSVSYQDWRDEPSVDVRMQMMVECEVARVTAARERLLSLFDGLQLVGLGGDKAQKVFASVMNTLMTEFIRAAYTGQWEGPSLVSQHLRQWIEDIFAQLVVQVLAIINVHKFGMKAADRLDVNLSDVEKWQEIGISRLGALRTGELFEVIVEWPASSGAVEDLKLFTTHPAGRHYVTHSFVAVLNHRLLHPGASTVEILQLYISIIRAFNLLDAKGVLLDRIARPIRRYLKDRDDTIKVIVGGLLADSADTEGQPAPATGDKLVELAAELTKAHQTSLQSQTGELDWDDMNWVPDPIDAAPDYRKSKSSDVIGSLISLFDSKETFVKEMQNMLADRLLQKRADFEQETSVLELLKIRFGDTALQACEVMLRDIFDSRRVDAVVRNDQGLAGNRSATQVGPVPDEQSDTEEEAIPELHAKILSHFFWPEIQGQEFKVPEEISQLQQRYATGFESLKQSRKLSWLNGLGQVTVELDLEDRVFMDEVTTWQAGVIYAFQSASDEPITKNIGQLSEQLEMSGSLVRSACLFWVSKRILTEVARDTFRVLEVLPTDEDDAAGDTGQVKDADEASGNAAAAADVAAAAAARESAEAAAMEKMNLYWHFIVGMLTNQGAMPLQQIVMMLKIAVPGGFPFSNEELREFLAGMVGKGKLEIVSGGSYKIVNS